MDFIGPISPQSLSDNRYTLTISDYFTRFGWAKALPLKEAEGVVYKQLTDGFGIKNRLTTPYHPQVNAYY